MKISGGAWKLVLAFFFLVGVWFNFLLSQLCYMYFELACAFGLVVWYGWTYQDRKAEYDETRAKIAQTEEHLREMKQESIERAKAEQEARERAAREQAERVKSEQEEIQRELVEVQPAFDKLCDCYKAYASLPKTLNRKDFIDSDGYLTYSQICDELIDCIDAIDFNRAFKKLFTATLVPYGVTTSMYESSVFTQGLVWDIDKKDKIPEFFEKIKVDVQKTKTKTDLIYSSTYTFDKLMVDISIVQPEADTSADRGATKSYDDFPDIPLSKIAKNTIVDKICDFFVVDVETTGLRPYRNEIIQLTAMRFEGFEPVECFSTYVMPRKGLTEEAQEINGIYDEDLEGAPYIEQVIAEFDRYIGNRLPLVGHNITFDLKFLHAAGSDAILAKRRIFDTCDLARSVYESSSFRLDYLTANELRILRKDAHDSKSDCLAAGMLFKDICQAKIAV